MSLGRHCLARGVRIETPGGSVPIERLGPGDAVITVLLDDRSVGVTRVKTVETAMRECVSLAVGPRRRLRCTTDHPVLDPGSGQLRPAGDWSAGHVHDVVVMNGEVMETRAVEAAPDYVGVFEVFGFTLDAPATTLVAEGVVVGTRPG